jgi:hypothetical protein
MPDRIVREGILESGKEIKLPSGHIMKVDESDYLLLKTRRLRALCNSNGYTFYCADSDTGKLIHRELLSVTDSSLIVDHINGDGLDNRRLNLRVATRSQNNANRKSKKNGTSKYLGVYYSTRDKAWYSKLKSNGEVIFCGKHANEIDAAKAYDAAAIKYHGEFANLNFKDNVE